MGRNCSRSTQEITHRHMSGAFSLGMLEAIVKRGESAKRQLINSNNISDKQSNEIQKAVWSANRAKIQMEEIKARNSFYDEPARDKIRDIESYNFDEILKGEVIVEVYYESWCFSCENQAHRIWEIVNPVEFKVTYIVVNSLPPPPSRKWVLREWPHILVNGHEVSMSRLAELVLDAMYIRKLEARKTRGNV